MRHRSRRNRLLHGLHRIRLHRLHRRLLHRIRLHLRICHTAAQNGSAAEVQRGRICRHLGSHLRGHLDRRNRNRRRDLRCIGQFLCAVFQAGKTALKTARSLIGFLLFLRAFLRRTLLRRTKQSKQTLLFLFAEVFRRSDRRNINRRSRNGNGIGHLLRGLRLCQRAGTVLRNRLLRLRIDLVLIRTHQIHRCTDIAEGEAAFRFDDIADAVKIADAAGIDGNIASVHDIAEEIEQGNLILIMLQRHTDKGNCAVEHIDIDCIRLQHHALGVDHILIEAFNGTDEIEDHAAELILRKGADEVLLQGHLTGHIILKGLTHAVHFFDDDRCKTDFLILIIIDHLDRDCIKFCDRLIHIINSVYAAAKRYCR